MSKELKEDMNMCWNEDDKNTNTQHNEIKKTIQGKQNLIKIISEEKSKRNKT